MYRTISRRAALIGLTSGVIAACERLTTSPSSVTGSAGSTAAQTTREILTVTIRMTGDTCKSDRKFVASPGSTVTFLFPEHPDAEIYFVGESPFNRTEIALGSHVVRKNAAIGEYTYHVTWGEYGSGNGSGEIIP